MKLDDLDQILLSDRQIEPSASFTEAAMKRIREESCHPVKIQWSRLVLIMAVFATCILMMAVFPAGKVIEFANVIANSITNWLLHPENPALYTTVLPLILSCLGTLVLLWLSFRLANGK